jgi:hypothetical protein
MKAVQKLCLSLAVLVGVTGFAMLAPRASADVIIQIGPQPAPVGVVYHYVYYPEEEVYFVPETRVYWWADHGTWRSGPRIPDGIKLGVNVKLDVDGRDPWQHHSVIHEKFPGHKHDGDRDHGDRDHK